VLYKSTFILHLLYRIWVMESVGESLIYCSSIIMRSLIVLPSISDCVSCRMTDICHRWSLILVTIPVDSYLHPGKPIFWDYSLTARIGSKTWGLYPLENSASVWGWFERLHRSCMFVCISDKGMTHLVGAEWYDLFDVVITRARKPKFFTEATRSVNTTLVVF